MSGWARVDRKVLDPPACQGQGTGHKQPGWYLGEAAPKPKETGPRERQRSELQSDASWQVHRPADGMDRSGHGAGDFLKVLRASRARSGVGAEPAPTGAGKKAPEGPSTIGDRGLSLQISGDAIGNTMETYAPH